MPQIRVRARALDMLGRQQIAGVPTAISELFKNAHDAYASRVEVDFRRRSGLFVLRDDGLGMSYRDFIDRWLTLGTESKLDSGVGIGPPPTDPALPARPILGEKGIGRLAIAAIGPQVLVMTRSRERDEDESDDLVVAFVHWGTFALPGVDLNDIHVPVRRLRGGTLPSFKDVQDLLDDVRSNLDDISVAVPPDLIAPIVSDLGQFDVAPDELYVKLPDGPSLVEDGCGTHFIIQPTENTLPDDIDGQPHDVTTPALIKMLIGFTNTMTSERSPAIQARFRDHGLDGVVSERIAGSAFFTPTEFCQADHHVTGEFDAFGQFRGRVQVYGGNAIEYLLPWPQAAGRPLSCGPFSINFGYVQGEARATKLTPEEHARLIAKLNRIGGLYIYRDGIRVLPYGNSDYDFLNIEQRRTKSAGYYFFSYRRIFGVIDITRASNPNLVEKAGREGFRENTAYRQLKRLLEHFFVQLAAEFFREGGYQADNFLATRADLEYKDKLRRQRARQVKIRRNAFTLELDAFFEAANARVPETSVDHILARADERFASLSSLKSDDEIGQLILDLETETRHELTMIDSHHRVVRPRGFGLTRQLQRDWDAYRLERHRLEENVFRPAGASLEEIVTRHATRVRADLNNRRRLSRALEDTSESQRKRAGSLQRETRDELAQLHERVLARTRTGLTALEEAIRQTVIDFERTDTDKLKRQDFDRVRADFEERILSVADTQSEQLEKLREQLKSVATADGADSVELTDALEEELEALRERETAGLELAQVGMALGIVHHEFSSTINGIRNSIRQLKRWADANQSLQRLYGEIRANFDHLDGYLTLFTPLNRRLQRHQVEITGSDIHIFLVNLFGDRLRRHHVDLRATPRFLAASIFGFPSSFYPCFVNLVDNAVFWLASRQDTTWDRFIELDADGDALTVTDNGPGISVRDAEAVFEMGFTRRPGGRGMGLYISRRTLEDVGFELSLMPVDQEKGASFRIAPSSTET